MVEGNLSQHHQTVHFKYFRVRILKKAERWAFRLKEWIFGNVNSFILRFWNFGSLRWTFLREKIAYSIVYTRTTSASGFFTSVEKHKLYAGYGPLYAHAHSNRYSQFDRFLYPGDGPSTTFAKMRTQGSPLSCVQGSDATIRRLYIKLYAGH
jgi:hypothetical protein